MSSCINMEKRFAMSQQNLLKFVGSLVGNKIQKTMTFQMFVLILHSFWPPWFYLRVSISHNLIWMDSNQATIFAYRDGYCFITDDMTLSGWWQIWENESFEVLLKFLSYSIKGFLLVLCLIKINWNCNLEIRISFIQQTSTRSFWNQGYLSFLQKCYYINILYTQAQTLIRYKICIASAGFHELQASAIFEHSSYSKAFLKRTWVEKLK